MLHLVTDEAPTWKETAVRATAAAIPYVGGTVQVLYEDVRARSAAKAGETIASIVRITGEPALAQRMSVDPVLEALFVNAVDAALRTGLEAKRRLLARAVADAVMDEARLDESQLVAAALAELDVPHVRALKRMADEWKATEDPAVWEARKVEGRREGLTGQSEVFRCLPEPIRATLVRTGTALPPRNVFTVQAERHRQDGIADFGLELIEALEREGLNDARL